MPKYRKKPVEIEAIQFTGSNWGEIETFVPVGKYNEDGTFNIVTLEGEHKCSIGDFVIQGVAGEFYPCKPDIFAATYEPADPTPVQPYTINSGTEILLNLQAKDMAAKIEKSHQMLEKFGVIWEGRRL